MKCLHRLEYIFLYKTRFTLEFYDAFASISAILQITRTPQLERLSGKTILLVDKVELFAPRREPPQKRRCSLAPFGDTTYCRIVCKLALLKFGSQIGEAKMSSTQSLLAYFESSVHRIESVGGVTRPYVKHFIHEISRVMFVK